MAPDTDILVEVTRRLLQQAGDDIDMLYFYDDVGSNLSLLISKKMWQTFIRPCHQKLIDVAKQHDKQVMYHTDGAVRPLIPYLIEMGIDVLNPIQPGTAGMEAAALKRDFGAQLSFHGGVDIVGLLPKGSADDVREAARRLANDLGRDGGYIMAGSHHIQCDTPLEKYHRTLRTLELVTVTSRRGRPDMSLLRVASTGERDVDVRRG